MLKYLAYLLLLYMSSGGHIGRRQAWIFTLLAIFVEVLSIVGFVVYLREHTSLDICFRLRSLVCSILVLINGVNLLRADDGNAYISAGFTYLVCALPSFSDLLIIIFARAFPPEIGIRMMVIADILRFFVTSIATPCALCAGYFWSNGRSMNNKTSRTTPSEHTSTGRGMEAGSHSCTARAGFAPPDEAPSTVFIARYATLAAMVLYAVLLVQLALMEFPDGRSAIMYTKYLYLTMIPVLVVGAILLRSYRKATFKSAGCIYMYASIYNYRALCVLPGIWCVVPVACLIALLVGMVSAFWSCPYLPRRAHHHEDNGKASGHPNSHAGTEPARGLTEPLIRHAGHGLEIELRSRRKLPQEAMGNISDVGDADELTMLV